MKRKIMGIFFFSMVALMANAQIFAEQTLLKQRKEFRQMCENSISEAKINNPESLSEALWIISAFNYKGAEVDSLLDELIVNYESLSSANKYSLLSVLAEYPSPKRNVLLEKAIQEDWPKLSLLAYSILHKENRKVRMDDVAYENEAWPLVKKQIDESAYRMELTDEQLRECVSYISLHYPQQHHLIVLARADRNIPAKVYVLAPGNSSLKGKESLSYLARSAYNTLPYFTNGNTPCGVFKIKEKSVSTNSFIGPVTTLVTELPYESPVEEWSKKEKTWSENVYETMWPAGVRKTACVWQAYIAGKVGRGEIIVHGSTIDPYFFKEEPYFPLTPSLGCLSAFELWDMNTGHYLESHQKRLVDNLPDNAGDLGFMYVLQVDEDTYMQN